MLAASPPGAGRADFAALARSAGTPQVPGLRIVYLSPLGDPAAGEMAQHHRPPDRRAAGLGARAWRQRAGEESAPARRDAVGRDRRHGLLGDAGDRGHHPRRRRQPQRQQVHRQLQDLSPGHPAQFDRRGIRRQLSRRRARRRPTSRPRRGWCWCASCRSATASRSSASTRTTGSTTRITATARAAIWRSGARARLRAGSRAARSMSGSGAASAAGREMSAGSPH